MDDLTCTTCGEPTGPLFLICDQCANALLEQHGFYTEEPPKDD
jgi:hypothetical protein